MSLRPIIERQVSDDGSGAFSSILKPIAIPVSLQLKPAPEEPETDEQLARFEGWKARVSATTLEVAACILLVGSSYANAERKRDWISGLMWHAALWWVPHGFVHKDKTFANQLALYAGVLVLLLQPHMDICRRVPYVGAIHGSASVMTIIRSFQYYLNQEAFKDWKPWRRMFFISAWGWHDIRQAKFVKSEEENDKKLKSELKRLAIWFSVMMAGVLFNKLIWGGNAYAHLTAKEAFQKFFVERDADMWKFFAVRWGVGYWTLLAWFYAMDSFPRSLHFWATQHELKMISDDAFSATTLKEFWGKRWNVPVQDMLVSGVYLPISRIKSLPLRKTIAKLMVFVVSGLGHTYAISCGGSPWTHLAAMFSFFMVQIPLIAAEDALDAKGIVWMMASEMPFAPLFIEPCLTFCHL